MNYASYAVSFFTTAARLLPCNSTHSKRSLFTTESGEQGNIACPTMAIQIYLTATVSHPNSAALAAKQLKRK